MLIRRSSNNSLGSEDQALTVHSKKSRRDFHHPKGKHSHQKDNPRRSTRDLSRFICYACDEKGHFAKYFLRNKGGSQKKKNYKRRHHAHAIEDDERSKKRSRYKREDYSSKDEYVLIYTLIGNITHGSHDWLMTVGLPNV